MTSGPAPRVSIGLPVYNGDNFLAAAIDTLLNQTFTDFELIISDNASTDGTEAMCREYAAKDPRVQYHRSETNYGAAWNFNNTFHLARGEYFKWAAHDDTHHPEFLARCVEVLDRLPEIVLCFSKTTFIDATGKEYKEYDYRIDFATTPLRKRFLHFVCGGYIVQEIFGLIRSEILRDTKLIDGYLGSDLVLLGKLTLSGNFYQIQECLFQHREHEDRSMKNPAGADNATQWYDSSKSGKRTMPHWRRMYENGKSVIGHPLSLSDKVDCLIEICRYAKWRNRELRMDIARAFK
jgi:glycosyltransferase involved in cell wall biosynthesis